MSHYQCVLLLVDQQARPSAALDRAVALSQASAATLHVAMFVEAPATLLERTVPAPERATYLESHRKQLETLVEPLRQQGVAVVPRVIWSEHRLQDILDYVAEVQPGVLIKDVHHEPALRRAFAAPLDWKLLRDCPVPVHLVAAVEHPLPRKVIAAVDPSRHSVEQAQLNERIIHEANGLAIQCGAELHLLFAGDLTPSHLIATNAEGAGFGEHFVEKSRDNLARCFTELADRYGVPARQRHFLLGAPLTVLADYAAQSGADVLVMGVVRRHGVDNLLGSTTEHLLYRVPCSILAVKP